MCEKSTKHRKLKFVTPGDMLTSEDRSLPLYLIENLIMQTHVVILKCSKCLKIKKIVTTNGKK